MEGRAGDIVCAVRLDRLGRSLKELLETVDTFKELGLAFRSPEERLAPRRLPAIWCSTSSARSRISSGG